MKKIILSAAWLFGIMLTTNHVFAQSGSNHPCTPSTTTNVSISCPSITNNGALSATDFCVNQGDPTPPWPFLNPPPSASAGEVVTTITTMTTACTNSESSSTNAVTYSFSGLKHRDGNGPPTGNSSPRRYWSNYYVEVTSSDTNNCPASPTEISYGTVSWNVVDPTPTKVTINPKDTLKAINQAISMIQSASKAAGCSGTNMSFKGKLDLTWQNVCCNSTNGPYKKSDVSGNIEVGLPSVSCQIPGASVPIPYPVNQFVQLGFTFTLKGSGNASAALGVAAPCQTQPICINVGATVSGSLDLAGSVTVPYGWATCNASAGGSASATVQTSGPNTNGECSIAANLGKCDLNWSFSFSSVGVCIPKSGSQNVWAGYSVTNSMDCWCF